MKSLMDCFEIFFTGKFKTNLKFIHSRLPTLYYFFHLILTQKVFYSFLYENNIVFTLCSLPSSQLALHYKRKNLHLKLFQVDLNVFVSISLFKNFNIQYL